MSSKTGPTVEQVSLPKSATSFSINLVGLFSFLATLAGVSAYPMEPLLGGILCMTAYALPIALLEFYCRSREGLQPCHSAPAVAVVAIKLLGFVLTLVLVALFYWIFPEYRGSYYQPYYSLLKWILPFLALAAPLYFYFVESRSGLLYDGYWQMGQVVLGNWSCIDRKVVTQHLLGWLVKCFFLPLMFVGLVKNIGMLQSKNLSLIFHDPIMMFDFLLDLIFTVDLGIVVAGYLLSLRILDSHIRSTDSTIFGWSVALVCYQPFWSFFSGHYLAYGGAYDWKRMFQGNTPLLIGWGLVIVVLLLIYLSASLAFGLRFSNLTNRGIVTNGPYRWTKHPAYLSKNLAWWFMSIPFLDPSRPALENLRASLLLLGLNTIYFLRAKSEEKYLLQDADYRSYALWIERNGIFRWVPRFIKLMECLQSGQGFGERGNSLRFAKLRKMQNGLKSLFRTDA